MVNSPQNMKKNVFSLTKPKVLLLENIHSIARDLFLQSKFDIEVLKSALSPESVVEKLKDVHVLGIRSKTQVTARFLRKLPSSLRWVAFVLARAKSISKRRKRTECPSSTHPSRTPAAWPRW